MACASLRAPSPCARYSWCAFSTSALATQAVFEFANLVAGEPSYEVTCHSLPGGSVKASLGTALQTRPFTAREHAVGTFRLARDRIKDQRQFTANVL